MKRSISSWHGASTGIALTVGGAVAVLVAELVPGLSPVAVVAIQTLVGALVRLVEALVSPALQRSHLRAEIERARHAREDVR